MNIDDIINRLNELNEGSLIPYYAYNQLMDMCFEIDEQIGKLQTELTQLKAEKSGEWVRCLIRNDKPLDGDRLTCSICGLTTDESIFVGGNYCPNCGAKMEKEENQ